MSDIKKYTAQIRDVQFGKGVTVVEPVNLCECEIGNDVSIGSNVTLLPVSICANVVIGAGAVITKNITEPGVYIGNPAIKTR
jgi:acetyltransferase-like isoleucine patch superfamily enzyme